MTDTVKVLLVQMGSIVGDLEGNCQKILSACKKFPQADIAVTPELSICGYPPEDLIFHPRFISDCADAVNHLAQSLKEFPKLHVLVGYPLKEGKDLFNAVSVLNNGKIVCTYRKQYLPNYGVFDERRYFTASHSKDGVTFEVKGNCFGINICEDIWHKDPPEEAKSAGAQVLLIPNASPYEYGKSDQRFEAVTKNVTSIGLDAVYVNMAGGQDEILFDGRSFVSNHLTGKIFELDSFTEACSVVEVENGSIKIPREYHRKEDIGDFYKGLVAGFKSYVQGNGFKGVVLGLSGGVDSALVLKIACDAVGPENTLAVLMPSRYTSQMSIDDATLLSKNLGVRHIIIPIEPAFMAFEGMLAEEFKGRKEDITEENLQARIRGVILMAISNKEGLLVATTGNKSEMAVGYSTLYGDLAGGYAVIKDVYKTEVYKVCRWLNETSPKPIFPENILTRAPSAELKADQKDQDSLPEYSVLDAILKLYLEHKADPQEIISKGFSEEDVLKTLKLVRRAEYKRRQSPIGSKMTQVAFGKDWRYPIVNKYTA
ncbi:MAG: NAD+ synthase [Burkholderiales bacterium]|nr:NAD+ synthase [Burkholderiales bacterium]